jgi:molybdenum cofactor synthesis domain-containing protein
MVVADGNGEVVQTRIIPDEIGEIRETVRSMIAGDAVDVLVTTGGTGIARRDVTPEALLPFIEKRLPGLEELVRIKGFEKTPFAVLSRLVCGTSGKSLIVSLPGNPRGAAESLTIIWPALVHGSGLLRGCISDCNGDHTGISHSSSRDVARGGGGKHG